MIFGTTGNKLLDLREPGLGLMILDHLPQIANALENVCRYAGHTTAHYSVAAHSLLCVRLLPPNATSQDRLFALLHDIGEAFIGDIPEPIKRAVDCGGLAEFENRIFRATCDAFFLSSYEMPDVVVSTDTACVFVERAIYQQEAFSTDGAAPRIDYASGLWLQTLRSTFREYCRELKRDPRADRKAIEERLDWVFRN